MKNVKKLGIAFVLIAVLAVGIILGVTADDGEYTGDINVFETLVQAAIDAETIEAKEEALVAAEAYIAEKPIDPEIQGYGDAMELYRVALLGGVNMYLDAIPDASGKHDTMVKYSNAADRWFLVAFDTEESRADARYAEYLDKVHASNIAIGNTLCDSVDRAAMSKVDTDNSTTKADGAYKFAKVFFDKGIFDTAKSDYTDLSAKVGELIELYTTSKEARHQALLAEARMTDYANIKPAYTNNFQGSTGNPTISNNKGYDKNTGLALNNTGTRVEEELPDGTKNTYFEVNINGAMNQALTSYQSTYITLNFAGTNDRFVMEFDFTSKTTLPNSMVYFQSRPSAGTNTWMSIDNKGNILDHNGNVIVQRAIVPGEWTHISIVCEMENIKQSRLYVDYAFAGYVNGDHKSYNYTPENMRIGNAGNSSGQFCFDNININFHGSICDTTYLDKMENIDKFIYLCNYMQRTGDDEIFITIPDCVLAYDQAKALSGDYYYIENDVVYYRDAIESLQDPEKKAAAKKAVDDFVAYDPTEIILTYKKDNLNKYKALVEALENLAKAPTTASTNARNSQVAKIQKFIAAIGSYMFNPGDDNAEITLGSGLISDPYILPNGPHGFTCKAEQTGWIYYLYTAKNDGTVKLSTASSDITLGWGFTAADVAASSNNAIELDLEAGDVVWFAIKSAGGAAITEAVAFNVEYDLGYNYEDLFAIFSAEIARIEQDQAITKFISIMLAFDKATSATLLQSRYDAATLLLEEGLNTLLVDESGYEQFKKHLEITYANAPTKIENAKKDKNSKEVMAAINYLLSTYPDESDWKLYYIDEPENDDDIANNERYTFISNYVVIIRGRIDGGNYNPDYISDDGTTMDIVIQKFSTLNEHYYGILQGEHYAHLGEQLRVFEESSSYIEKKGIISYIQRYLNDEDVQFGVVLTCENSGCASCGIEYKGAVDDVANPTCPICEEAVTNYRLVSDHEKICEILQKYTAYEAELEPQKDDYDAYLSQNTIYFVNAVKMFDTAISYVDKLALLNKAMPYYYAMNNSGDGVDVAESIAKYDALAAELEVVQKNSRSFIETVMLLPAMLEEEGIDGYYATLVSAAALRDKVDASIDGVPAAVAAYEAELAEYERVINAVNGELKESASVLGTLGANCGFTAVLSVVLKKIFAF